MFLVIYFESNESVLCYELRIIPKNGKALSRKRDKFFKFRICSKMENLTLSSYNFVFKKKFKISLY